MIFSRLRFRTKIFLSQLVLFLLFALMLFPFVEKTVKRIAHHSLNEFADDLISNIQGATSQEDLVNILQRPEYFTFFRVSLLDDQGLLIYDSYLSRLWGQGFTPFYPTEHPEVNQAIKEGYGYNEGYSQIFSRRFIYIAKAFDVKGQKYILRLAFPYSQLDELSHNFDIGFIALCFVLLLFFSIMTLLILYSLSRPISEIIKAITPYQRGESEQIPKISLRTSRNQDDDFVQLARTINSLSERIQEQIQSLKEERDEKEAILESLGEGVIAVDRAMSVRYVNFTGCKMLGIPKEQLLDKPFPTTSFGSGSDDLLRKTKDLLIECQKQRTILTDFIILGNSRKLYLDLVAAPKSAGSGAIVVLQDKSSNYKILEMGKDFVANASHELRTPITIIKGFAETLQDLPTISPKMLSDIIEKIIRNCERMENLVKKLLLLADIENLNETRFKRFDLVTLLENCRHVTISLHPEITISIEKSKEEIKVEGEADLLELAVMNILDNAIKYSRPPAEIRIHVEPLPEGIELTICDNGIGIPEADIEHVFERFYTVDKTHSRKLGGAGLGLSIVKTIIEKHGGTIRVRSNYGEGTCFTMMLPIGGIRR